MILEEVVSTPFEKYVRQIGSFPQVGVKIKNVWNHHLYICWRYKSYILDCLFACKKSQNVAEIGDLK